MYALGAENKIRQGNKMLTDKLKDFYRKLRLVHYRELFGRIRERDGSLSATEAFAVDVVYLLGNPTVSALADALGISQPNATYKINNLSAKGYVVRTASKADKRECHISVGERFYRYYDTSCDFLTKAAAKLKEKFTTDELETFERVLAALDESIE